MYYQTDAIILKNRDFKEADKLVIFLAQKEGKLAAVARGIKKPNSSLRGLIQPFCHSRLHISRGRGLDVITQGRILNFFGNLREDVEKTLNSAYVMELLDKSLAEADPHPDLFDTALVVLEFLDENPFSPLVIRWFEMKLAGQLGYSPGLYTCARCGTAESRSFWFGFQDGGLVCEQCASTVGGGRVHLSGESLAVLRILSTRGLDFLKRMRVSTPTLELVELLLEKHLQYRLERRFSTKSVIKSLKDAHTHND